MEEENKCHYNDGSARKIDRNLYNYHIMIIEENNINILPLYEKNIRTNNNNDHQFNIEIIKINIEINIHGDVKNIILSYKNKNITICMKIIIDILKIIVMFYLYKSFKDMQKIIKIRK